MSGTLLYLKSSTNLTAVDALDNSALPKLHVVGLSVNWSSCAPLHQCETNAPTFY